ncbi:MAG: UvrD-helicase domain-containing protein [Lachnospiraceae bacterium]|nr:UvrD-helicase domain-containing protein [Lachnospiraceae bacterium]
MELFERLNEAQTQAVSETEGYIRVVAGAGSGKTRALTHRFVYLVSELGIAPGNIMCVTFTNKAAQEMKKRIHQLTGDKDTAYINTFHGFCVSVLSEESNAVNYPKSFLVLDNSDINSMLDIIYEERGLTLRDRTYAAARDMIEIKKTFTDPNYHHALIQMSLELLKEKYMHATETDDIIFYGYLYQQKKCFGLDYNDLIIFTLHIFEENEEIRRKWQSRLAYIMIDEFQDIDDLQYKLMQVLCQYHKNLFVVGDPDQTIYTWRGARVAYLLDFAKTYPSAQTIMMMENYRSTPEILDAANALISKNVNRIEKNLLPVLDHGDKVLFHHAKTSEEEAKWICAKILELQEKGVALGDISILCRAHYLTAPLEKVFIEKKLPYGIYSGIQFFDRAEIKTALCYLRMLAYKDDLSFMRVINTPKRNIGKSRTEYLKQIAESEGLSLYDALKKYHDHEMLKGSQADAFIALIEEMMTMKDQLPVSELLTKILEKSGYEKMLRTKGDQERLDNLAELKQLIYEYEATCGEETDLTYFLEHIALYTNADEPAAADKVKIMTIHAAKGLEFPYVFICGMNEGIFPSKKAKNLTAMEEERRLCFVAFTRAQKALFLSDAEGSLGQGFRFPSRFVLELDEGVLDYDVPVDEDLLADARANIKGLERILEKDTEEKAIPVGTKVFHKVFGEGTILGYDDVLDGNLVLFDKLETPRTVSASRLEVREEGAGFGRLSL